MSGRGAALALGIALAAGCDGAPDVSAIHQSIVGGARDEGDPAVVAVGVRRTGCDARLAPHCTGILVAPRLVLTAAHCVADPRFGRSLEVMLGSDAAAAKGLIFIGVVDIAVHPEYRGEGDPADLAALRLERDAPVPPLALDARPLDGALVGRTVRVAGFGLTDPKGAMIGVKHAGTARVTELGAERFRIAAAPAITCRGDSGGPVLIPGEGGKAEAVIGVVSRGDPGCADWGLDVRVDRYHAGFIAPAIAASMMAAPMRASAAGAPLCTAACARDADCPAGLECQPVAEGEGGARCVTPGLVPGTFDAPCYSDNDCDERCVRLRSDDMPGACLCHRSCRTAPSTPSGCSIGRVLRPSALWVLLLLLFAYQLMSKKREKRLL